MRLRTIDGEMMSVRDAHAFMSLGGADAQHDGVVAQRLVGRLGVQVSIVLAAALHEDGQAELAKRWVDVGVAVSELAHDTVVCEYLLDLFADF